MNLALAKIDTPSMAIPEVWDYEESVKKVSSLVYKWKNLTVEVAQELYFARERLSVPPEEAAIKYHGTNVPRYTWSQYCREIGIEKRTANRWLKQFFPSDNKAIDHTADSSMCAVSDLYELIRQGRQFKTILADPPWSYSNQATRAATDNHYATMSVDDICNLPIDKLTEGDAHLHLWTTNAFLYDARKVMEAWGFDYKSVFVWTKPSMGIGNYWRLAHEFMLFGMKGNLPFQDHSEISWWTEKRSRHSSKPETIIKKVEKVSPAQYLELFGRNTRPGWVVWGNQIRRTLFNEAAFNE